MGIAVYREFDGKQAPFSWFTRDCDAGIVQIGNLLRNGQPNPDPPVSLDL